jgi:hypothetical protein
MDLFPRLAQNNVAGGRIQHVQYPNQTIPGTPDSEPKPTSPNTTEQMEDIELY